jgi:hypothetical protein
MTEATATGYYGIDRNKREIHIAEVQGILVFRGI